MTHVSIGVYNYSGNKLCDLYDSFAQAYGEAYNIVYVQELSGWQELTFNLPYVIEKQRNFRWDYIRSEYLIRLGMDDQTEWFIIQKPKANKNTKAIYNNVTCPHISTLLKTKNLYLTFDDETGIGTVDELVTRALTNTGWTLGDCDTLYERDGTTEKIRSLNSDGKQGSYQLITDICNLFKAYPVYHGDTKTVDIHALNNKGPMSEMCIGKNLNAISVEPSTENIITRLYVEGEYGDYGYVGIDDVNPTGLSYLMDFDYYKSIGTFTATHQTAYDTYLADMSAVVQDIKDESALILAAEDRLNELWGQIDYVVYTVNNGTITKTIPGGTVTEAQKQISEGDELYIFKAAGNYRVVTAGAGGSVSWEANDTMAAKFITLPNGLIGAKQVAIEAKEKMVVSLTADKAAETDPLKQESIQEQIDALNASIALIYSGDAETDGLYDTMREAVELVITLDGERDDLSDLQAQQLVIESTFSAAMGDMLRDGYWADNNYAPGQEEYLYQDAIDVMTQMAKPTVRYTFSEVALSEAMGYTEKLPEINDRVRVWDEELNLNDVVYVSKRTQYLDNFEKDTVEVTNDDPALSGQSFESILSRITQLADLVNQKNTLYDRAKAISANGSIYIDRLNGTINVLKNKLSSTISNWYTDDSGALIFEAVTGDSAMMLTGGGWMIADGKTQDGDWNWKTAADGHGIVAERITAGYISTDRIEAGSISVSKVDDDFGTYLDISDNGAITSIVQSQVRVFTQWTDPANDPSITLKDGDIWYKDNGIKTWGNASALTWQGASAYPWGSFTGAITYVYRNNAWKLASDIPTMMAQETVIQQTQQSIGLMATKTEIENGVPKLKSTTVTIDSNGIFMNTGGVFSIHSGNFGVDPAGNVFVKGTVTAGAGEIGGWTLGAHLLSSGASSGYVALDSNTSDTYAIWAGNETASSAPFSVTRAGAIKGTSGTIGGWTLGATTLSSGTGAGYVALDSDTSGTYAIWAGNSAAASATFSVTRAGAIKATSGQVGGWTLGANLLSSGSSSGYVALDSNTSDTYALWAGNETAANASFSVSRAGAVKAVSGEVGGWTLGANILSSGSGTSYVGLDSNTSNDYAIWAGDATAANGKFRVKRDGSVYLTKLVTVNESGTETTVDLSDTSTSYPLWKLYYATVKSLSTTDGYCTSLTFSNGVSGSTTVNFKPAAVAYQEGVTAANAAVTLSGSWSGQTFTVTNSANARDIEEVFSSSKGTGEGGSMGSLVTVNSFDSNHKGYARINSTRVGGGNGVLYRIVCDASGEYSAGEDAVGVYSWSEDTTQLPTVTVTVTLTNGKVRTHSFTI